LAIGYWLLALGLRILFPMQPLAPPDSHHFSAASGWLGLGCAEEALAELGSISEPNRHHPDVLELGWLIQANREDWKSALQLAEQLVHVAPKRPAAWLHRAYAMRRVPGGGLTQAWSLLLPAAEMFPAESLIPYNLACYACRLGRLEDAWDWLQRSMRAGRKETIRTMALRDEDLHELWNEIRSL
jgi:Flp pilus assembly protein TadD